MGILTRRLEDAFVISSDHVGEDVTSRRAPAPRSTAFQVWTGSRWSTVPTEGLTFASLDAADGYVRVNYTALSTSSGESTARP